MSQWATLSEPRSSAPPRGNDDDSEDEMDQLRPSVTRSFRASPPMDRTRPPSSVPAKRRNDGNDERDGRFGAPKRPRQSEPGRPVPQGPARPPGAARQPAPPPGNRQGPIVRRVMVDKSSLPNFRPAAQRERDRDRDRPTGSGSGSGSGAARVAGGSNRPGPPGTNRPNLPGPSRPGPSGSNRPAITGPNRAGPPGSNRPPLPTGPRHSTGSSASRPTQPLQNSLAPPGRPNISASQPAGRRESPESSPSPPPPATQPAVLKGVRPFPLAAQVAKRREDRRNSFKYDDSGAIEISSSDDEGPPVLNRRHTMPAVVLLPGTHMEGDALVIEDSDEEPTQPPPKPAAPAAKTTQATTAAAQKAPAKPTAAAKPAGECIDLTFSDEEDELLLRSDDPPPARSPSPPMLPPAMSPSPPPMPSPRSPSPPMPPPAMSPSPPPLPSPRSPSPPPVPPAHSPSPSPLPSQSPPPPPFPPSFDESRPATPIRIGPPRGKRPAAPSTPLSARKDPDVIEFPSSPAAPQGTPATPSVRIGPPIGKRPTVQSPKSGVASASSAFASSVRPSEKATRPAASTQPTPDADASTSSVGTSAGPISAATAGGVNPPRSSPEQASPAIPAVQDAPVVPSIATLDEDNMDIDTNREPAPPATASAPPSKATLPPQPLEYYLKYYTAPVKTVDVGDVPRWTLLCKLCETLRSVPRQAHEQEFDPRMYRGLFGNISGHVRECHLDVDHAQLKDVTVQERAAQWKGKRRFTLTSDGGLVFGSSHLPKNDDAPSVPAAPPAAQLETPVAPESPQVRRVGRPVDGSSSVADPARSPESAPGLDERIKRLLALWGPPQKDVWRDVPRWQFVCNACPAKRTIARNPSHKTFEEGRWGWSVLSPLRTHTVDKHPDLWALVEQQTATAAVAESQVRPKPTSHLEEVDPELMEIDDEDRWNVESPLVAKARLPQATVSRSLTPTPPPQTPPHVAGELQDEDVALSSVSAENLPQASTPIAQTPGRPGPGVDNPLRTQGRAPGSSRPVNPFASPTVFHPSQSSSKAKRVGAIEQYMSPLRKDRDPPAMSPSPMASASAQAATSAQTPRPAVAPHPLAEMQVASSSGALTDDDADVFGPTRTNSSPSIVALSRQPSAPANVEAATPCPEVDMDQVAVEHDAPPLRASSSYRTESPASSLEVRQMLEDDGLARPVPLPAPAASTEGDKKFIRIFADAFIGVWRRRLHESAAPASNLDIDPALDIPPTPPPPAESPSPLHMPAVDPAVAAALTVVSDPSPGLLAPALEAVVLQSDPERQPSQDTDDQRRRTRSMSRHSTDAETMSNDGLPLMQVVRLKRARHARRSDAAPGAGIQQASPPDSNGDLEPLTDLSDCGPSAGLSTRSKELALIKAARDLRWPAEEVDTLLYDVINDLPEYDQYDKSLRTVFEHVMLANTLHDEPDAPPITVDNKINDDPCPPWEFYYTNKLVYGQNVRRGDPTKLKGCNCVGGCRPDSKTCACLRRQQRHFQLTDGNIIGFNYDQNGRVVDPRFPIFECNDACGCDETCMNRVVQHGRQIPVEIANTRKKGWGVFAKSSIPANTFVGIYAGELITDRESHARGAIYELFGRTYMFTIDNWYLTNEFRRKYRRLHRPHTLEPDDRGEERPDDGKQSATFVVDAFHVGNFTRFLNHCCDPNCVIVSVHINEPHIYKPYLCLFTCKDVKAGEELTFSYRGVIDEEEFKEAKKQNKGKRRKRGVGLKGQCQCGAPRCIGTLF